VSIEELAAARKAVLKAQTKPTCNPASRPEEVAADMARIGQINPRLRKVALVLGIIRTAMIEKREVVVGLQIEDHKTNDGHTVPSLCIRSIKSIGPKWACPTVIASATAQTRLLEPFWGDLLPEVRAEAEAPHQRVRQIVDMGFGSSNIVPAKGSSDGAKTYSTNLIKRLRQYIEARHEEFGGLTLVVAQMSVIKALGNLGSSQL
jgi:hypothetical protein